MKNAPSASLLVATLLAIASTGVEKDTSASDSFLTAARGSLPGKEHIVTVGPRTPVSLPGRGVHWGTLDLVIDPDDKRRLIVCGTRYSALQNNSVEGYLYASVDGGRSWLESLVDSRSRWVTEESCAIGPDHAAYFLAGASDTSSGRTNHKMGRTRLYRSGDGALTWTDVSEMPFLDWTSATTDFTTGPHRGRLYVFANGIADGRGAWFPPKLALVSSLDEGQTFSSPAFAPAPTENARSGGAFPNRSLVLNDGTVIAVVASWRGDGTNRKNTVEVVVSRDGGRTLEPPVLIAERSTPSFYVSLGTDPRNQNLYVSWIEESEGRRRIALARSTDQGSRWVTRFVLADDAERGTLIAPGKPSVAVNHDGVVGLLWPAADGTCGRIAFSHDGGESFGEIISLGPCGKDTSENFKYYDSFLRTTAPWLEVFPRSYVAQLGISMRMLTPSSFLTAMVTDSSGAFHPVWPEWYEGKQQLWTREITVGHSLAPEKASIDDLQEVTNSIEFEFANNRYDRATDTLFVDVILLNKGRVPITAPIRVQAWNLRSDFGAVEIDNSDNGVRSDGAVWDCTDSVIKGTLMPGRRSRPRTLAFKLGKFVPKRAREERNPVSLTAKVFAQAERLAP